MSTTIAEATTAPKADETIPAAGTATATAAKTTKTTTKIVSAVVERKTADGLALAELLKLKLDVLKDRCLEANVGVTGKKEVLAEKLLNPKKHQLQLLKQQIVKAIKDGMTYKAGVRSGHISWHRDGVKWAAFAAAFPSAKRSADCKTVKVSMHADELPAKGLCYGGALVCSYAEVSLAGELLALSAGWHLEK